MNGLTISVIQNQKEITQISKLDELVAFQQLENKYPKGLYLSELFSTKMEVWLDQQMKNDFPCDPLMWVKSSEDDLRDAQLELAESKKRIAGFERAIAALEVQCKTSEIEIEKWIQKTDELREMVNDGDHKIEDLEETISERDQTIINLKAQLWDALPLSNRSSK